ncbi:MAG: GNAT family N-acetyltransferase [Jiangellaceae bacterium]
MGDLLWRSLTPEDVPAWVDLEAAAEAVDKTGEHFSAEDLAETFDDETFDPGRDSWAVLDGGRLVAAGSVHGSAEVWDVHSVSCYGVVDPDYRGRGIGRRLLAGQLDRAAAMHAESHPGHPARIAVRPYDHVTPHVALAKDAGLVPVRHWFEMGHDLRAELVAAASVGGSLRLVPFTADRDDDVRRAHNDAFRGHFGSTERDPAAWKQWYTGSRSFRPELSFLVVDGSEGDAIAGYLLTYYYDADTQATGVKSGWVGQLGTRAPWRGRGAGTALLARALAAYADAGFDRAALDVDSANESGALGLYERLGFAVVRSSTSWARELPARRR